MTLTNRALPIVAVIVSFAVVVPLASAQTWPEIGDAGALPEVAQRPAGAGPLQTITGDFTFGDPDMYEIYVTGNGTFSALAQGAAPLFLDPQLYLFDEHGHGVYANENMWPPNPFFSPGASLLPAEHMLTPLTPGRYFLAISTRYIEPVSLQGAIFPCVGCNPSIVAHAPTGPGGADAVTAWPGFGFGAGSYTIALTGAEFVATVESVRSLISALSDQAFLLAWPGQVSLLNKLRVTSSMVDADQLCQAITMMGAINDEVAGVARAGQLSAADAANLSSGASSATSALQAVLRQGQPSARC
jgi:hypothetical protein